MNILIANLGNIRVNEIKVLADALSKRHKVTIVCMSHNARHRGLAFSPRNTPVQVQPFLYKEVIKNTSFVIPKDIMTLRIGTELSTNDNIPAYEFNAAANPADAISITLTEIMAHKKPDLVICGLSNGEHMGHDIYCSSNIGMAMEACFHGVKTMAVAVEHKVGGHTEDELRNAAMFIEKNVEKFAALKLPAHTFLNINIPTAEKYTDIKGVKVASMGHMTQLSTYSEKTDCLGEKYYWANLAVRSNADNSDKYAKTWYDRGYITIVPLNYNSTDYEAVKTWNNSLIKDIKKQAKQEEVSS